MTSKNLLQKIRHTVNQPDQVPAGFKTSHQWREEWDLGIAQGNNLISQGVAHGLMECKRFRVMTAGGRLFPVNHYAEIKAQSPKSARRTKRV